MAKNKKLGKRTDIRLYILKNQASELLWYGKLETTLDRAKSVKRIAEKMITLAVKSYEDTVKVYKDKLNQKEETIKVEYQNDGPKKLAARRKILASLRDLQEIQGEKEKKADYKERTAEITHPLVEKIFREYAPKYAARAAEKGTSGGYTRIIKLGARRGDDAEMCILELVD
ncbi:MAG: 50S ribosomal protein L17 [Firmicutes bacterium ADurb.Bin080]|jgi:large subunit ribosomal protein L17|nr:50S ribosomal protein L17 [Clostridiales bacterium]OQC15620.1 MAG: 50S ribosomal protein L17 [Firmicutes bacterium ADurb.Bin080]